MKGKEIANQTAIYLKALPRCNMKKNCQECLALTVEENEGPVAVSLLFGNFQDSISMHLV